MRAVSMPPQLDALAFILLTRRKKSFAVFVGACRCRFNRVSFIQHCYYYFSLAWVVGSNATLWLMLVPCAVRIEM